MADSATSAPAKPQNPSSTSLLALLFLTTLAPIAVSLIVYRLDEFDSAPIPEHAISSESIAVPKHYGHVLNVTERVGDGLLPKPEDLVYDPETGYLYASCEDGWIKRVRVRPGEAEVKVENWAHVGGWPLGLAFGPDKELFVAESYKGLMKVTREGVVKLLTDEAEGLKFKLTDGVDVAQNGVIYFTDASYKYNMAEHMLDILEGRPYGRLLSFDPSTNKTQVLLRDLYFANGITVSPEQDFVVFCETPLRRCSKYYIKGEKSGSVENFINHLPGYPDNIHYDGKDTYWIAIATEKTMFWDVLMRYPTLRKIIAIVSRYVNLPNEQTNGGVISVNLNGQPMVRYSDPSFAHMTVGIKVEDHLYFGSLATLYIRRLNLTHL